MACDPNQRKCAPANIDDSLLARTIQAKDDAGWVARVVWGWCRMGVSTRPMAGTMHPVWLTSR